MNNNNNQQPTPPRKWKKNDAVLMQKERIQNTHYFSIEGETGVVYLHYILMYNNPYQEVVVFDSLCCIYLICCFASSSTVVRVPDILFCISDGDDIYYYRDAWSLLLLWGKVLYEEVRIHCIIFLTHSLK